MSWSMRDTLLHAGPWETLPDDRPRVTAAARRYAKDPRLSKQERDYIARIWLPREESDPEPLELLLPLGVAR